MAKSDKPGRIWFYNPFEWRERWYHMLGWPSFGGTDEYYRRTMVWGTFLTGYIAIAGKVCTCEDCVDARLFEMLEEQYDTDLADQVVTRRIYLRTMPREGTPRV